MNRIKLISAPLWQGGADINVGYSHNMLKSLNFDYKLPINFKSSKIVNKINNKSIVTKYNDKVYKINNYLISNNFFPLLIGGDHSISIGSIMAASNNIENIGVVYVDAHGDLNSPDTSPSGNAHGMSLMATLEKNNKLLSKKLDNVPRIDFDKLVLFGIRDLDNGEVVSIEKYNIRTYLYQRIQKYGLLESLDEAIKYLKDKTNNIHISVDLDVLDPKIFPGVSVPVKKGFGFDDLQIIIRKLFNNFNVISIDIVEYNSSKDYNNKTKESLLKLINIIKELA